MPVNKTFYTRTMAEILAKQKKYREAAEIYRYLLANDPGNDQFAKALAAMEAARAQTDGADDDRLVRLFQRWIDVTSRYQKVKRVKKLKPSAK